jgi:hypothetical protein
MLLYNIQAFSDSAEEEQGCVSGFVVVRIVNDFGRRSP